MLRPMNTKVPAPDPLPRWLHLPLERKLPMLPAPKGAVCLSRASLSRQLRKNHKELAFDLTDPHLYTFSSKYEPLHDTYLRTYMKACRMRGRLSRAGFITRDKKVLCTLKEYNAYRAYLWRINLALEKRQSCEEKARQKAEMRWQRRVEARAMVRDRKLYLNEVQQRLANQPHADNLKCMSLAAAKDAMGLPQDGTSLGKEEKDLVMNWNKKQEIMNKMGTLHRWLEEDIFRERRIESKRIDKEEKKRRRLLEEWEIRKQLQSDQLAYEDRKKSWEQEDKARRIDNRQTMFDNMRIRQAENLFHMISDRRQRHDDTEEEYQRKLRLKIANQRRRHLERDRRRRMGYGDDASYPTSCRDMENNLNRMIYDPASKIQRHSSTDSMGNKILERRPTPVFLPEPDDTKIRRTSSPIAEEDQKEDQKDDQKEDQKDKKAEQKDDQKDEQKKKDECHCSLTLLHKVATDMGDFDDEALALAGSLKEIMTDLKLGKLVPLQVQKLTEFAKNILEPGMSPEHISQWESLTPRPKSPSPDNRNQVSDFSRTVIAELVGSVQETLLPITEARQKPSNICNLTKTLAQKAVRGTTQRLLEETNMITSGKSAHKDGIADPSLDRSYTSDLVTTVLQKSARRIVRDMQGSVESADNVKADLVDIIEQCMQELVQEYLDEKLMPKNPHKPNYVSVASMLVRDTITDVITEMCEQGKIPSPFGGILPGTATSVFVESVIIQTLKDCLKDIRSSSVSTRTLVAYTADIIGAHQEMLRKAPKELKKHIDKLANECGYLKASSVLLDGFIFHVVFMVLTTMQKNDMSKALLKDMNKSVGSDAKGTAETRVKNALVAVLNAIGGKKPSISSLIHWDTKVPLQDIVFSNQAKSLESLHAETAVLQALHDGQKKVYKPTDLDQDKSDEEEVKPERNLSTVADRCASMAMGKAVQEYFGSHTDEEKKTKKVKPPAKMPNENVDDLVDYSIGLVIMQLANEVQNDVANFEYPAITAEDKKSGKKKSGKVTASSQGSPARSQSPRSPGRQRKKSNSPSQRNQAGRQRKKSESPSQRNQAGRQRKKSESSAQQPLPQPDKQRNMSNDESPKVSRGVPPPQSPTKIRLHKPSPEIKPKITPQPKVQAKPSPTQQPKVQAKPPPTQQPKVQAKPPPTQQRKVQAKPAPTQQRKDQVKSPAPQSTAKASPDPNKLNVVGDKNTPRSRTNSFPSCAHTVIDGSEFVNSDESNECLLEPMVDDKNLDCLDHRIVEDNLSVLSLKHEHDVLHYDPSKVVARNSFRSLVNPNVHKVRRFSAENSEEIAKHFEGLVEEGCGKVVCGSQEEPEHCISHLESHSQEDLDAEDDSAEPDGKDDVVNVTEIHTKEEFDELKELSSTQCVKNREYGGVGTSNHTHDGESSSASSGESINMTSTTNNTVAAKTDSSTEESVTEENATGENYSTKDDDESTLAIDEDTEKKVSSVPNTSQSNSSGRSSRTSTAHSSSRGELSVLLTPKTSMRSLPAVDGGGGAESGQIGIENDQSNMSVNLSPKSSVASMDAMSRAGLSHPHAAGPEQTASDTGNQEIPKEPEAPHSPVGSLPDMQQGSSEGSITDEDM